MTPGDILKQARETIAGRHTLDRPCWLCGQPVFAVEVGSEAHEVRGIYGTIGVSGYSHTLTVVCERGHQARFSWDQRLDELQQAKP